jgi:alanine racemase
VLDAPGADAQLTRFDDAVQALVGSGLPPLYCHLANSAALAARPNTWKNMVRPGLALYGYFLPFTSAITGVPDSSHELPVQPVLTWKTRIVALRNVPARTPIGYSGAYVTQAPARLAVLPVGYADGLCRQLSSRGRVIVRGHYAPIVGNVAMDLTTVDVTGISGVEVGDEVLLIGAAGPHRVSAWDHAGLSMTLPYEVLCGISRRVPRKFVE